MAKVQPNDQPMHSLQQLQLTPASNQENVIQEKAVVQPKNKKWTDSEHARYILFLQLNREKIKSKLIRRSNSFFLQMAAFIKDKNGVQCRSHHQKYQTRYKYPHRIIREEKEKLDKQAYNAVKSSYLIQAELIKSNHISLSQLKLTQPKPQKETIKMKSMSCQTEIQGLNRAFIEPQQLADYSNWLYRYYNLPQSYQGQYLTPWGISYPFMQPANPYVMRPF